MNNLTLDEYEKIYLTSSTITEETDIENYLLDLLPLSRKTALEAFDNFKAVLYIHSFYNFYNPAFDISMYSFPQIQLETNSDLFEYMAPETFIPVLKLVLQCFKLQHILQLDTTNYCCTDIACRKFAYYTREAYTITNFEWKIPIDFMPVFSAIVYAIYRCRKNSTYNIKDFLSEFTNTYTISKSKVTFCAKPNSRPLIIKSGNSICIHSSKENFTELLKNWAEKYLAISFFQNMDFLYSNYSSNTKHQILLYKSARTLIATLISSSAMPEIYPMLNTLLEKHILNFPDTSNQEECANLYPHHVQFTTIRCERILINDYIKNTKTWSRKIANEIANAIEDSEHSKDSPAQKYDHIKPLFDACKKTAATNYDQVLDELNKIWDDFSSQNDIYPSDRDTHIELIDQMLTNHKAKLTEELDLQLSRIKKYFNYRKILPKDIINDLKHNLPLFTAHLSQNWISLKTSSSLPTFTTDSAGSLKSKPLNIYAHLNLLPEDLDTIVKQLNLDYDKFISYYFDLCKALKKTGTLIFYFPDLFALTLSKYLSQDYKS